MHGLGLELRRVHRQLKVTMPSPAEPSPVIQSAIAAIEAAFADVRLGSGVSIRQADAIDNYDGEEEQALARELDEHEDWKRIPEEVIHHTPSAMCFMDVQGILFQLPASMCFAAASLPQCRQLQC